MRKYLVSLVFLVAACGGPSREELASLAAKGYYEHLIHGEYEQFYEGMDQRELSGEESYRSQMLDNLRQFMARQEQEQPPIRCSSSRMCSLCSVSVTLPTRRSLCRW